MNVAARLLIALALLFVPDLARAHPAPFGVSGFPGGLIHPLFVPLHALTILALSLLIGQQSRRWGSVAGFIAGVAAGSLIVAGAYAPTFMEWALLAMVLLMGAWIALAKPVPEFVIGSLAAAAGFVIALDSPPDALTIRDAILMQFGTFLAASILVAVISMATSCLARHWQRIATRIVGSWIAATAILVLALKIVR